MTPCPISPDDLARVPLFPLPNVVLLPHATLPLHIFEERYKSMMQQALSGQRLIAMALLKPGWEKNYYGRAAIEPVVCVGRILSHERLADGNYNLLLHGAVRARIGRELPGDELYRTACLEEIVSHEVSESELLDRRDRLRELVRRSGVLSTSGGRQLDLLFEKPCTTADIADVVAYFCLEDLQLKQAILGEPDPRLRIDAVLSSLSQLARPPVAHQLGRNIHLN